MSKVIVRFLKSNESYQPGDIAGIDADFAERLISAEPPRIMYPSADDEEVKAAIERASRRGAQRKLKIAATKSENAKKAKEGKKFLEENPDVDVASKVITPTDDKKKKKTESRRRQEPIKIEE